MILTESDRIILIALAAGFLSGSCQSILRYIIDRNERQIYRGQKFIAKFLYLSFSHSIILGMMAFVSSVWDISMSAVKLNQFTIAMAIFFAVTPLYDRIISFIFSRFKISE